MSKKLLLVSAMTAGLLVGCSQDNAAKSADAQKYKILNGSVTGEKPDASGGIGAAREPAINPQTRFAAGQLAESQNCLDCATIQYEQALRLDPRHIPSLYRLGIVYTKTHKFDQAVAIWKRYIAATNNVASGYSNLGFCYEMAGKIAEAEKAYKDGLAIDPTSKTCRINYGLMLARNNRVEEAQVQLATVLPPAQVSYDLAAVYQQQGAIAQAKDQLKKALEANPNMTEAEDRLASLPED